ncbi:hypothetical protein [Escherichia coli]|uniref:hypothetical protein n=1 Tax=Escherichia coli TaxID=562 RepID=UPI00192CFF42|nr:hypothetical protein [Escherichia coli]
MRHYTGIDKFINSFDQALRSLVLGTTSTQRENPGKAVETQLAVSEARHVAGLMRVCLLYKYGAAEETPCGCFGGRRASQKNKNFRI